MCCSIIAFLGSTRDGNVFNGKYRIFSKLTFDMNKTFKARGLKALQLPYDNKEQF